MNIQEKLRNLGLSPNEAKCYISLLKLGSSSANEISRHSGIHRVAVYDALRGLREKGLVSQITKENKMLFEASNPEHINHIIEEKVNNLQEITSIIPLLTADFSSAKQKQDIHTYKGIAGIKVILKDLANSKTEILDFGSEHHSKDMLGHHYENYEKERIKNKIMFKVIMNIKKKPGQCYDYMQIKYVPQEVNSRVSTFIYDNKVAMVMWVEPLLGLIIEHKDVYESYKNYFEFLWKTAQD